MVSSKFSKPNLKHTISRKKLLNLPHVARRESTISKKSSTSRYLKAFASLDKNIHEEDNTELEAIFQLPYIKKKLSKFTSYLKGLNIENYPNSNPHTTPEVREFPTQSRVSF